MDCPVCKSKMPDGFETCIRCRHRIGEWVCPALVAGYEAGKFKIANVPVAACQGCVDRLRQKTTIVAVGG